MSVLIAFLALLNFAQSQDVPAKSAAPALEAVPPASENLLGKVNSGLGESRRNENVQFNQIDNNGQKETQNRMGTRATAVTEFRPEQNYFGAEFGNKPGGQIHLAPAATAGNGRCTATGYWPSGPRLSI